MDNDKVRLMIEVSEDTINECKVLFGQGYANNAEFAISQGTPYNPSGDLISREVINSEIEKRYCSKRCVVPYEVPYCPDNCPARLLKNIVKECPTVPERDYSQGWHDAITKALNEAYTITTEDGSFKVVQTETLEGLGMSMPDKKGGADNEKNDK